MQKVVITSFITLFFFGFFVWSTDAQTVDELQQKIDANTSTIQELQQEINQLSTKLGQTSAQRKTLQNTINQLELNSKKLQAQINLTNKQISTTNVQIQQLALTISSKASQIKQNQLALSESIKHINESDAVSPIETLLVYPNISAFSEEVESELQYQDSVKNNVDTLLGLKKDLETSKSQSEQKKTNLVTLQSQLLDQNQVIKVNESEKAKILVQTKNQESAYQKQITDKEAKEKAFEDELNAFQAQLKIKLNPSSIPGLNQGLLAWPLTKHLITQFFGNTDFAQAHAAVYSGSGHNGIDIAASIGTPVMAAADGTVEGTGNTDTACPGASFGQWVMIKHNNGLSTLYAHLSVIKAVTGQSVSTGDILGYSGMTGYATGPHLHFTVYASQGVEIISRASKACSGRIYTLPVADLGAYLNPLNYLSNDYTSTN